MLKPIKTLLTYLQKNANSSTIFGLTTNGMAPMGPNEEPPTMEATHDMMTSEELNCEDPLYDPLALDECDNDVLNVSNASAVTTGTANSELDSSTGQIILVDMTNLKSPAARQDDEDDGGGAGDVICSAEGLEPVNSSVNGHDESALSLENGDHDETKSTSLEDESFTTASCGDTPNVSIIGQSAEMVDGESEAFADVRHVNGGVVGVTESATEVTDGSAVVVVTQENEEEEASDGSDSGLGSEPSRNLSTLEKEMTELPPVKSNLKRRSAEETTGASAEKRPKKGITFDGVTVYYFTRMQGFGCVPSQGGCTLGMEFQHVHSKRFTLAEHAAEQRKMHRAQLQELNPRSSSSEETDSEEEPSESGSEAESESYGFLQPVTTRQRRALLKAAGVRKIDSTEKDECRVIRTSREVCGCTCRGYCDPDTCSCSQAGIKCQVDRPSFPCGCTQDGCANVVGRVEFNPARVRTHFIHTIMRINLDNKANSEEHAGMGMHSAGGYGNSKDWSSGPVRLPGLYGMVGVNGIDAVDSYHHHHHHLPTTHQPHPYAVSHNYLANHSVSPAVPAGTESLDLHYAFRDYYGTTQQANDQLSMSSSLMAPYYGNYPTSMDQQQYHQPHHSNLVLDQRQPDPHSPYHSQMESTPSSSSAILDEDATLNTPINPNFGCDEHSSSAETQPSTSRTHVDLQQDSQTSCSSSDPVPQPTEDPLDPAPPNHSPPSADFIDLNTPLASNSDRLEAINDLLASSRHQLTLARRSIIAEEDDELSDFRDPPVMPLSSVVDSSEPCSTEDDTQDETSQQQLPNGDSSEKEEPPGSSNPASSGPIIETSENLSEIIKNSIVETVSN
ncbi:uncharacterized protein Axud1 [Ochlerotatus camptorhynchus]|uniref:uncharacterized protein Axud1 n=1 Tax=Ochlerotatus camptorhynchus TaxID=644619 RepID=UPI0031DE1576